MPKKQQLLAAPNSGISSHELYDTTITVTLVGTTSVGKSSLFQVYTKNEFPDEYCPTVIETASKLEKYEKKTVRLEIYDTGMSIY